MRRFFTSIFVTCLFFLSNAQTKAVFLNINHAIDKQALVLENQSYSAPNGVLYKLKRLQYYISDINIVHDGGQITECNKVFLLVDPKTFVYGLGDYSINSVEKITFKIGIDSLINHGDPSLYPTGHPLAPQNPSMHWGWASGYRFAAIEGNSDNGNGLFNDNFEFHTIGDDLLTSIEIPTGSVIKDGNIMITLESNYNMLFNNINLYGGIIQHGNLSPNDKLMSNFKEVFKGTNLTSTNNTPFVGIKTQIVNLSKMLNISYTSEITGLDFTLFSESGIVVYQQTVQSPVGTIVSKTNLQPGVYFYNFKKGQKILESGKIVIAN